MKVGIIGSGNIGSALAQHLSDLGHEVSIANSRGPETLTELAEQTGAKAATVEEAAAADDLIIITIPEKAIPELPAGLFANTKATIIDTGNYYPVRDGQLEEIQNGLMDSQWVEQHIGHSVIKAFNNIYSASLASKAVPAGTDGRIALSVAGDDATEKQLVLDLIEAIGFDAIDTGSLGESWKQEPGSPAYCHDLNKEALRSALDAADLSKRAEYREAADAQLRQMLGIS
jgi:predicted dinucleotide-binding enzyme